MMKLINIAFILLAMLLHNSAYACVVPDAGAGWNKDQLIDQSEVIVVAVLMEVKTERNSKRYRLKPVETLKGSPPEIIEFRSSVFQSYSGNTFSNHNDNEFWKKDIGRSPWPCCLCGPQHTFIKDEKYLLFPDAFGAFKSGEIIKSSEDKWYQYVRQKIQ
jgi:hypothetical protein